MAIKKILFYLLSSVMLCGFLQHTAFAAEAASVFSEGTDYQTLPGTTLPTDTKSVTVMEFFSLGCPWCYHLEADLDSWLKTKPKNVIFIRVPVAFNSDWALLAKAYYTADALGVTDKVVPALFKAIHQDKQTFNTADDVKKFFVAQGVAASDFDNAFNFSPEIDAKLMQSNKWIQQYQIIGVPTMIIAGRYSTGSALVNGDGKKLMQVVNFLIQRATTTHG